MKGNLHNEKEESKGPIVDRYWRPSKRLSTIPDICKCVLIDSYNIYGYDNSQNL